MWYTFNSSIQEAETGGILYIWGQPGLQDRKEKKRCQEYMPLISTLERLRQKSFKQMSYSVRHTLKVYVCVILHIQVETIFQLPFQAQKSLLTHLKESPVPLSYDLNPISKDH